MNPTGKLFPFFAAGVFHLLAANVFAQVPFNANLVQMPFYGNYFLHDPGTMIKNNGSYFIYGDGQGISGITSTDLRNWGAASAVFPPANPPAWTTNAVPGFTGYFWAPDNAYFNGRYNLYYACSQWGTINSAIGLVTTPSLTSPMWTDQGKVIESNYPATTNTDTTAYNCIDPSILVDTNGTVWMSFGSYSSGILVMQLDPATGKRFNTNSLTTYLVANNAPGGGWGSSEEGSCLYQHGGYYYLFVNFGGCCAGVDSTYNIRVGRSSAVTGPYLDRNGNSMLTGGGTMFLESTARFIGPGHAAIMNDNGTNWFTYHFYDGLNGGAATVGLLQLYWTANGWPTLTNDWSAFYPLAADAHEHRGLYNGTLQNNAGFTNDPARGNVLYLDGATNYVSLPLSVGNASTFAAWVNWRGGGAWQRVFDFGHDTTNYFFLTPMAASGAMRFAISTNGPGGEQQINAPFPLPANSWHHVAVTLDGARGILYLDGAPLATNNALTIRPWQTLPQNNSLGKSQFAPDPLFAGEISSVRIFGRALSASEISDIFSANAALAHRYSFSSNAPVAVWDSIGMAHGTLVGNAAVTNNALKLTGASGTYANLPGGLVSGSLAVTLECWATFGTNGICAPVVDFGNTSGTYGYQYFSFSPHTEISGQRMELIANTNTTFNLAGTFDNLKLHVVCIVDPASNCAAIYTNGVLENATNAVWSSFPSVSSAWSFIGRSLWSSDAYLNGTIDELRIYDGRLTPQRIAANDLAGPNVLSVPQSIAVTNISLTASNGNLTLSWPPDHIGWRLLKQTNQLANGISVSTNDWATVASSPQTNQIILPINPTLPLEFYRLIYP
jgi:arabinan endo-1,5-alpha-L-arabinosidase